MLRFRLSLTLLLLPLMWLTGNANSQDQGGQKNRQLIVSSERILFLGEQATYQGGYVASFESWLTALYPKRKFDIINLALPGETLSGISEDSYQFHETKQPRPHLEKRLDTVLKITKPQLIFACYGTNCPAGKPFDKQRFSRFQQGARALSEKAKAAGSRLIFLTPPPYETVHAPDGSDLDKTIQIYSEWLLEQRQQGWMVIDIHSHLTRNLSVKRQKNPAFTYYPAPDQLEPSGHWAIAQAMIHWFGDPPAAESPTPWEMLSLHHLPAGIHTLVKFRMILKRDAWLKLTHQEKFVTPQSPTPAQAQAEVESINLQIKELMKLAGQ